MPNRAFTSCDVSAVMTPYILLEFLLEGVFCSLLSDGTRAFVLKAASVVAVVVVLGSSSVLSSLIA